MSEPSEPLTKSEYLNKFSNHESRKEAFKIAVDVRKFEIELYWKRATYFWTFIGATLAGYGALQASSFASPDKKSTLSILLACLGIVFSVGWFLVNKGSKKWQANWERNVDLLEDSIIGPLFATRWDDKPHDKCWERLEQALTGPGRFSGSRINQLISLFIVFLWVILWAGAVCDTLPGGEKIDGVAAATSALTFLACIFFGLWGRTSGKSYYFVDPPATTQDP